MICSEVPQTQMHFKAEGDAVFGGSQTGPARLFLDILSTTAAPQTPARTAAAECHQDTDEHTQKGFYNQPDFTAQSQRCWKLGPVQKNIPVQPSA